MWLKNTWYIAAFENELEQPIVARRLLGTAVVMFRTSVGQIAAMEDVCPHRLMPLSLGKRVGDDLQCGYHGMKFSVEGKCVEVPGQTQIPAAACLKKFPAVARHGFVWVWLGDAALANPDLIPDLHWNDDPGWVASRGYKMVESDYRLMNDNLLDLSHETYVHGKTIGNEEEETIANFPVKVTVEGDRLVRAHREMPDIAPPPFFAMILKHDGPINRWQTAINLVPGINMTDVGVYPVGTEKSKAYVSHVLHLLTPETETTTHYFWSIVRNYRLDEPALTEAIRKAVSDTFDEDKIVLEHQQRQVTALKTQIPKVAIRLDEAPMRARRVLDACIQRESGEVGSVIIPLQLVEDVTEVAQLTA
ncbi:MAG: aromatic ring-hydroxylating dioxygenase subunit alpha [Pseudomonadota bacterium]